MKKLLAIPIVISLILIIIGMYLRGSYPCGESWNLLHPFGYSTISPGEAICQNGELRSPNQLFYYPGIDLLILSVIYVILYLLIEQIWKFIERKKAGG